MLVTLITGTGIGLVVSLVASLFVAGLHLLTDQRSRMDGYFTFLEFADRSLMPMIWLIVAALLLWVVRRLFDIERWHGPADSIFGAHRLENEIDVKSGIGSTVGAFVSISGGASVGQYGPLVHFGATIGTFLRQMIGKIRLMTKRLLGLMYSLVAGLRQRLRLGFTLQSLV